MIYAEAVAAVFHDTYERLAPQHGYKTRTKTAVRWKDVPQDNKSLMIHTVHDVIEALELVPAAWLTESLDQMAAKYRHALKDGKAVSPGPLLDAILDCRIKVTGSSADDDVVPSDLPQQLRWVFDE